MIVIKFGGTSVSTKVSVESILNIVKHELKRKPVVIVSALSKVTNLLVELANQNDFTKCNFIINAIKEKHLAWIEDILLKSKNSLDAKVIHQSALSYINTKLLELENQVQQGRPNDMPQSKWQDSILVYGETLSSYLISAFLTMNGVTAKPIMATQCIVTDNNFGSANFIKNQTVRKCKAILTPLVDAQIVPIVTGFIGATADLQTTTLGRGGSDYSAAIIGYALKSEEIQIWTDVDGVYSADPRFIKNAKLLTTLSYQEASELAMFGAKVLHPRTILPAIVADIPVKVLNTFNPDGVGTTIKRSTDGSFGLVKAITSKTSVPVINIYSVDMFLSQGFLKKIFAAFTKYNISIDLVSASEVSVSVTLDNNENLALALKELSRFANVTQINDYGSVSLVGEQIMSVPHLMPKVFSLFENSSIPVHMLSYSAANINIGIVIPSRCVVNAVEILHANFIA